MNLLQSRLSTLNFYFLYVEKYDFPSTWFFPAATAPYTLLRYVIKGSAFFEIDGQSYTVKENDIIFIPEKSTLKCQAISDFSFISVRISTISHDKGENIFKDYLGVNIINNDNGKHVKDYFYNILKYARSKDKARKLRIRAMLYLIVAWLIEQDSTKISDENYCSDEHVSAADFRSIIPKKIISESDSRIHAIMEYILANPLKKFSADELCGVANISQSSMRKLFKKYIGKSPCQFINDVKMMAVARQLILSDKRISEIAFDMGYSDQNYFSRCFKKVFGVSPSEYRRQET
ncbi:MAG: helix-turn-helix transcriptional regulator [Christensenellaceae bacterium]|nr:helix-turn-helix transcriptional regulator [Christensenellaceae bacterium]